LCELAAEGVRWHEVREGLLAVDLHDRERLAVAGLELRIAGDVDLLELERLVGPHRLQHAPRRRAEMALGSVVEDDPDYGYKPRVIVASETRCTANPYAANRIVVDLDS
jgi:hypothetical protein